MVVLNSRELLYHRAAYFYHHDEFKLAVEEFKALHSDHKHSRTHSVAVIDSVIRCALKIPSYAIDDLLAFLSEYEQCALDYGDQLQYLSLKKDVYACIPGQRAEIIFVDTVCLLCSSVDLPEHWLAFGQRKDLTVGANFHLGYTIRASMLLERHLKHAHGFVVDVLRKKLSALNRTLEEMKCSPDQIREARKMMSCDLRHLEDENDHGDQLRRPAHECRSKVEVYKTDDEIYHMEQEGEGDEVFEIDDFTVITEFERFVVAIEALLQEWGVVGPRQRRKYPKGLLKSCPWQSKSSTVSFGETNKLSVKYCYPDLPYETITEQPGSESDGHLPSFAVDISNAEIDFTYHSNISTMYGVSEYILFAPADQVDDAIMTEDQKNVVKCPISLLEADDIRISVQFDYNVKFPSFTPKDSDDSCEAVECYNLPFGSKDEPIEEFKLIVSWPNLKEEVVNENEYHSDLDLLSAFNWSACVEFNYSEGMLDYVLTRIMDLQKSKDALETAFTLLGVQQSQSKSFSRFFLYNSHLFNLCENSTCRFSILEVAKNLYLLVSARILCKCFFEICTAGASQVT
ncbi:unnamed protein product [Nippostrongylus brasiliensis]|uniref:Uncharacterized protein n=1 Tax=Nippostrongylus brasiliensis TaxID=27835 RepID=A0A3P7DGJ7_NIPBR|nr:unnamed protein product [Nippostrongylus brasiliensis]